MGERGTIEGTVENVVFQNEENGYTVLSLLTEQGELVSSYQCSPLTVDEEFLLTKRLYEQTTGRSQKSDVIA